MERLKGKVCLITGGNSGIGAKTASLFAQNGAKVIITARRKENLEKIEAEIKKAGGDILSIVSDISKQGDPEKVIEQIKNKYSKLDVLVNNAGILGEGLNPIDCFDDEILDKVIKVNLEGTMKMTKAALSLIKEGGSIVNIASVAGVIGCSGACYVASKAGIVGITKHIALRYASEKIRCNAVCPGLVDTPMISGTKPENLNKDMFGAMSKHGDWKLPHCMPDDIANIIIFLASDESKAVTGQTIVADFGTTL